MSQPSNASRPSSSSLANGGATIGSLFRQHATMRPRHAAIVTPGFPALSYGELVRHIDRTGAALSSAGLDRASRVALLLPSGPELALTGIAVACNAIAVPCNPSISEIQFDQLHARLNLDALVLPAWQELPSWIEVRLGELVVLRVAKAEGSLSEASIMAAGTGEVRAEANSDDPALILQTSGTIGPPKLVPVSHRNLMAMAARMEHCFELSHLDRCACLLPLYYAQGIKSACIVPLLLGGSIAIPQFPVLDTLETWLTQLQPTWFPAGPTFLQAVLDRVDANAGCPPQHNLRFLISGSASLPEQVRAGIEGALGIPLLDAWGMTEVGLLTGNSVRPDERRVGTVGYASPREVAIMAPGGRLCHVGEQGEVVVRGPAVLSAYIADDETNRTVFRGGWFHTGDLGSIDADGFLTISGRIKEIINRGGEKISPDLVERSLCLHPAVCEAAAFAIPHTRLGEDVAAAVVLQRGANPTAADLQKFLGASLPHQAIPRSVFFLSALPKGPTGKILRKELSASCRPPGDRRAALPENELQTRIAALWQRLLQRADIGVEDDFFEAGGDSLLAAQMLLEAERITRKLLRGRVLPVPATIHALERIIADALPLGEDGLVTKLRDGRSTRAFFYCHGDYMFGGSYAYKLADLVAGDYAFYLLNNHDLSGRKDVPSIEELACGYLPAVLAAQPVGPIRIGGHCNGGLMAIELARQLSAIGRKIDRVVLIEPISLNARPGFRVAARLLAGLRASRAARADIMFHLWRTFRWGCERLGVNSPSEDDPASWVREARETRRTYLRLMANYTPPRLEAPIVCLTAKGSSRAVEFDWKPWRRLSPAVTAEIIPGTHISCLTTHVGALAGSMRNALAEKRES
jgi:acyl-CoA synthetase (AMP-forming)/AMP-acid ligase II/thioesterase domain-containing protein